MGKKKNKVNSLIDAIIPAVIMMIPIIFGLYILNIHGYFFPKGTILFRLNNFYQYLMCLIRY